MGIDHPIAVVEARFPGPGAEPAPYVMTEADVVRFCRLEKIKAPYMALRRYRQKGWLKATQVGKDVRYLLPDVLKFLETAKQENPR